MPSQLPPPAYDEATAVADDRLHEAARELVLARGEPVQSLFLAVAYDDLAHLASDACRDAVQEGKGRGWDWATVGRFFGVTRQAAQQRFGKS